MAKNSVADWSTTASDNTDVGGINLTQGAMLPSSVDNAFREMMAQIAAAGFVTSAYQVGGTDVALADGGTGASLSDPNADRMLFWDDSAGAVTWLTASTGLSISTTSLTIDSTVVARLETEDQTLTGGARVTSKSLGTITTGTVTLDPGDRPLQHYTNNGAHTLAPGSNTGSILLDITNGASAGAITTSGWTKVVGAFTTTNAHKFRCSASVGDGGALLTIQALQ